jgi:hypothetical protein
MDDIITISAAGRSVKARNIGNGFMCFDDNYKIIGFKMFYGSVAGPLCPDERVAAKRAFNIYRNTQINQK